MVLEITYESTGQGSCIDFIVVYSEVYVNICIKALAIEVPDVLMCGGEYLKMRFYFRHV